MLFRIFAVPPWPSVRSMTKVIGTVVRRRCVLMPCKSAATSSSETMPVSVMVTMR